MLFEDRVDAGRQLAKSLAAYRAQQPLILAIPRGGVPLGRAGADALVCLSVESEFYGVGQFYRSFDQVEDQEVLTMLKVIK